MCKIEGFEHLHLHSHYSLLDGMGFPNEYSKRCKEINQRFLCISDHGMLACVPSQIRACEEDGISPIFACELYLNNLQPEVPVGKTTAEVTSEYTEEQKKLLRKSYHLLAIAYTNTGYSNLVKLSSWGWTKGYYYKPRINYEQLLKHKEGIIFSSCCYMGEVGQAFDSGDEALAESIILKYVEMIGKENYCLEIMLLDFVKQKPFNIFIIKMAQKYGLRLILTNDCHYCKKEDSDIQRKQLMIQTGKTIKEVAEAVAKANAAGEVADLFELQDANLWQKSEEELNQKWLESYSDVIEYDVFAEAKRNTVKICERAKGVTLDRSIKLPRLPNENGVLLENIMKGFEEKGLPKTKQYLNRIKEEYALICEKEFSSYFLIQQKMTDEARRWWSIASGGDGEEAVGPGRGSGAGSLINYCLGVTSVDPIRHDLLFSRFLSPARGGKQLKLRFSIPPLEAAK